MSAEEKITGNDFAEVIAPVVAAHIKQCLSEIEPAWGHKCHLVVGVVLIGREGEISPDGEPVADIPAEMILFNSFGSRPDWLAIVAEGIAMVIADHETRTYDDLRTH